MSVENCYRKMKEYLKESGLDKKISDSRLKYMAQQLDAVKAESMDPVEFGKKAEELLLAEQKRWSTKKQAENLIVLSKREKALSSILRNAAKWKELAKTQIGALEDGMSVSAMKSFLTGGSLRPGLESNIDVRDLALTYEGKLKAVFTEGLKKIRVAAESGKLDRDMLQELWALDHELPEGQSGNNDALEYAKAVKAVREKNFEMQQANNPWLEKASDYLVKQMHDQAKIQAAGKDAWVKFMMERYSKNSFFGATPEEKLAKFGEVYDRISSGKWGSTQDLSLSDKFTTIRGDGGNLMRQMAHERVLIPNDWKAFADYQAQFGPNTIFEGMDRVMRDASYKSAQLMKFGTNPRGMYEGLYMRLLPKIEARFGADEAARFRAAKPEFDQIFNTVTGSQEAPALKMTAKYTQGAMLGQAAARTGFGWLRALPDMRLAASLVRDMNGKTLFENAYELTHEYSKGLNKDYANERLGDLELFSKSVWAEQMRNMGSPEAQPGKIGRMAKMVGVLNGLNRHIDAIRSAIATVLSKQLAEHAELPFDQLDPRMQQGLQRYGIDHPAWEVMRQGTETLEGRKLITPEGIRALDKGVIENYLKQTGMVHENAAVISNQLIDWAKTDLEMKLGSMLNEHANLGSAHAGSRQRFWMFGDTNINQSKGMFWRMVMQFKTAGLTSYDVTRRSYFSGTGPKGDMAGLAQNLIAGMFYWTLGEYASQLLKGKTPESPTSPEFVLKAIAGSATGGIFGDMLVNELADQGGSWKTKALHSAFSAAGPVPSMLLEGASLGAQGIAQKMGGKKDPRLGSDTAHWALSNLPIGVNNLFYTRAAWDYYFSNQLKNYLGPGYLGHLEQQTHQTPGLLGPKQEYLFAKPSGRHLYSGKIVTGER